MTRLTEAWERLDRALARLEAATRNGRGGSAAEDAALIQEMAAMRERFGQMESRTQDVSRRLDRTISRVRSLARE